MCVNVVLNIKVKVTVMIKWAFGVSMEHLSPNTKFRKPFKEFHLESIFLETVSAKVVLQAALPNWVAASLSSLDLF